MMQTCAMSHHNTFGISCVIAAGISAAVSAQQPRPDSAARGSSHQHYIHSALADQAAPNGQLAPRLQDLGTHIFPVSTSVAAAQLFINQGLNLSYAFNHAEAGRSFREAARLDPKSRDGVLGPGTGARPQHQCSHEPGR
jgi:hypothetical protein